MKYTITTLGCKVNQYETQALETMLKENGLGPALTGADVAIINGCAVTAESERKSRQAVRRAREENPGALIAVCGCFSQLNPALAAELGADIVYGSGERAELVREIVNALNVALRPPVVFVPDAGSRTVFERLPAGSMSGRTRAMLKIEDGCDNCCSYCVIPDARGPVRSLPPGEASQMAARLEEQGLRELIITGIEISSYGKDFVGVGLIDALEAIAKAAPSMRLRLGSLNPRMITEPFCERLRAIEGLCGHFHLSLQSGCDEILTAMGRKYNTADFKGIVGLLRRFFQEPGISADLITGFPGETERHHAKTLGFIEECGFSSMHIFPYSERPGTAAYGLPGKQSAAVKARRAGEAREVAKRMSAKYLNGAIGKTLSVLFETERDGDSVGHADNNCLVSVKGEKLCGLVKNAEIIGVSGEMLVGKTF